MDTTPEPAFERVVRIAARFFAMPMAAVSFVDEYRVWRKAGDGPGAERNDARSGLLRPHDLAEKSAGGPRYPAG